MTALTTGLLTEYTIRSLKQKSSQLSFLQKTLHEFLAALYLSLNTEDCDELMSRVSIKCDNFNDILKLFIFLCGIEPKLASTVSKVLKDATSRSLNETLDEAILKNVTDIMNNGYTEAMQNRHADVCLETTHIIFAKCKNKIYMPEEELLLQNVHKIRTIWCEDKLFIRKCCVF